MVDTEPRPPPAFGDPRYDSFDDLWSRLARPFEIAAVIAAVAGLPDRSAAQLVGVAVASSPEADQLLQSFPKTVRALATSVQVHPQRCVGSLRGPVLWSETMSARSASFGDQDLFVCATPSRAYDVDENHVLVFALDGVLNAATLAEEAAGGHGDPALLRHVRHNRLEAARFLDHPSLRTVSRKKPTPRALKRTRSGKHRKWYAPAVRMIERVRSPLGASDVRAWCDERTRTQHDVLMGVVHRLEQSGAGPLPPFRAERRDLVAGPVRYRHPRYLGDRATPSGIEIEGLLIDVPDRLHDPNRRRANDLLRARAGDRRSVVVFDDRDLDRAVELALEQGERPSAL